MEGLLRHQVDDNVRRQLLLVVAVVIVVVLVVVHVAEEHVVAVLLVGEDGRVVDQLVEGHVGPHLLDVLPRREGHLAVGHGGARRLEEADAAGDVEEGDEVLVVDEANGQWRLEDVVARLWKAALQKRSSMKCTEETGTDDGHSLTERTGV